MTLTYSVGCWDASSITWTGKLECRFFGDYASLYGVLSTFFRFALSRKNTMQVKFKAACLITFFSICNFANAEVYLGISPGTSIEEIKEKFPNAAFVDMKPAWATNNIKLYQMQGYGLGGLVVIKLDDIRPILKKSMNLEIPSSGDDDKYFVASGFRFIPEEPVKLDALIKRYGQPDKTGVDADFKKYVSWLSQGVSATLSDKKDGDVTMIQYVYTKEELENSASPTPTPTP